MGEMLPVLRWGTLEFIEMHPNRGNLGMHAAFKSPRGWGWGGAHKNPMNPLGLQDAWSGHSDLARGWLPFILLQNTHLHGGMWPCAERVCFCSLPTRHILPSLCNIYIQTVLQMDGGSRCRACLHGHPLGMMIQLAGASVTLANWQLTACASGTVQASHLKFKRTPRYGASRVLPRDAVRGRSVYLPRCKQVHGNRSVESPAPGETQPAASFRHGPSCRWDYPTPSWGDWKQQTGAGPLYTRVFPWKRAVTHSR